MSKRLWMYAAPWLPNRVKFTPGMPLSAKGMSRWSRYLLHLSSKAVDLHKVLQVGGQLLLGSGGNAVGASTGPPTSTLIINRWFSSSSLWAFT